MTRAAAVALTREAAAELDARDPLGAFRERFAIDPDVVYLDGNSLGCMPHAALERLEDVARVGGSSCRSRSAIGSVWLFWGRRRDRS